MFKRIKRNRIYADQWLEFYQDDIEFPDGSKGSYTLVDRKDGVSIVVVTNNNTILLNHEYRYVLNEYSWEIPGGGIDKGETAEQSAIRELYEETGITVETVEQLGLVYPLNSFNTESVTIFLARIESEQVTSSLTEHTEHVSEQKFVSFDEALRMIDTGEISDTLSANAIQLVIRKLTSA